MKVDSTRIASFFIVLCLFFPLALFGQAKNRQPIPHSQVQIKQMEVQEGKYVAIPAGKRTYSLAYRTASPRFLMSQVNVSPTGENIVGDAANEPSIAVDPTNPKRIAIGWRQFNTVTSNFRQAGYGYTTNGGQTWTFPGVIEPGVFRSDPVLDADAYGTFYYNSLTIDASNNYVCDVFKSVDGGATWGMKTRAQGGDKQWMIVDKTETIGNGNVYSDWTSYYSSCLPGFFTRGPFGGLYYENCIEIPGNPFWGTLAMNRQGDLYTCGANFVVAKSSTARDYNVPVTWDTSVAVDLDGDIIQGSDPNPVGIGGQTWTAVDQTTGFVYLLCSVARHSTTDPLDLMFSRSIDGGLTWSPPHRVNDDTSSTAWQWFGTMSVAPNGRIDVVWLDTRDNPGTVLSSLYYSFSDDFGVTWSTNERLSSSFDPHVGWPQQNKMGDYFHMVSDDSGAHLAWAGTFNGEEDVYYGRIRENSGTTTSLLSLNKYWNLISVPAAVGDYRKTALFPNAGSAAYRYANDTYELIDTLTNGEGYWMKFDSTQSVSISGLPIDHQEIPVHQGWNLIGSIGFAVQTLAITSTPPGLVTSRFFGYNGSYNTVDVLQPGKGHWVKVNDAGTLILSHTAIANSTSAIHVVPTDELPPPAPNEIPGSDNTRLNIPAEFSLGQNYPNPFNPVTMIPFTVKENAFVTLRVFNTLGQAVAVVADREAFTAGRFIKKFDATTLPSGVYYYRVVAENAESHMVAYSAVKKMVLMK